MRNRGVGDEDLVEMRFAPVIWTNGRIDTGLAHRGS